MLTLEQTIAMIDRKVAKVREAMRNDDDHEMIEYYAAREAALCEVRSVIRQDGLWDDDEANEAQRVEAFIEALTAKR